MRNNIELINITCRLKHEIWYFLVGESNTEIVYEKLEAVEEGSVCLPEECIMGRGAIEVN